MNHTLRTMALSPPHRWCLRRRDQSQQDGDEILGQLCSEWVSCWQTWSGDGKGQGVSVGWGELPTCDGQTPHPVTSQMRAPCDELAAHDMVSLLSLEAYEPLAEMKPGVPDNLRGPRPHSSFGEFLFDFVPGTPTGRGFPTGQHMTRKKGTFRLVSTLGQPRS